MDHEKFQQRLNEVLDNREPLDQDIQLRQMADADAACAESLSAAQLLFEGIDLLDRPTVGRDMADRVLTAVGVERKRARLLRIWAPICVAAALLLAAIPLSRIWQGGSPENPTIAKPGTDQPESEDAGTNPDGRDPGESDLDKSLGHEANFLVQTHRAGEVLGAAIWSPSYDQLTPTQKQWVERATEELSPVADPMANTVAFTVDAVIRTIEPNIPRP